MSDSADSGNAGETSIQARSTALHHFADHSMSREQAAEAVRIDLETLSRSSGQARSTALGTMGRIAESQRTYAEALHDRSPLISDQALTTAERQRVDIARAQTAFRQIPEGIAAAPHAEKSREAVRLAEVEHDERRAGRSFASLGLSASARPAVVDAQGLEAIGRRHEALQALPVGSLDATSAREAVTRDVDAMANLDGRVQQGLAAAMIGEISDLQPAYKAALLAAHPQYADMATRAFADEQTRSAAKEDRKAFEFADRRNDAADNIATRYENMERAGLSVNDLKGSALERLARTDSRDLLLVDGQPPHPRIGEVKALVAESMKSAAYRTTFDRESANWTTAEAVPLPQRAPGAPGATTMQPTDRAGPEPAVSPVHGHGPKTANVADRAAADSNSMRQVGDAREKHIASFRPVPPLEDRFNVIRVGLVEKEYHFRDQAGKVAFTDKLRSISSGSESPAAIKAMVDRAAERGWQTLRLNGSPEFVRQGWVAAAAQGLTAVGHTATPGDREAAAKERARLQVGQATQETQRPAESIGRVQSAHVERMGSDRSAAEIGGQRQLAAAIEKALVEGKVSPELRGQVRAMMTAEGARRIAKGERVKVPVYDTRAPRARPKSAHVPHWSGDRERSR